MLQMNFLYRKKTFLTKQLFCLLLLFFCKCALAQQSDDTRPITLSGKVTDENGEPLSGVSVAIKGTKKGTASNAAGVFTLGLSSANETLVFSFVGYITQELKPNIKTPPLIKMVSAGGSLNEVVVVGYGQVKKKDLTGSVGSVSIKDLQKAPVTSFDQALAGRVPGVQVGGVDGQPGAAINIIIRGQNSVTQENSPLYVVDGFPIENNDNNAINPADIESIDILKDASATAIYGARGANGVIMITTKRGKVGTPVVTYNGFYGWQENTKRIKMMSPYDFVKLQFEIDSATATEQYLLDGKSLENYRNVEGIDWVDKVFRRAPYQSHNISVSGGTAKSRFSVSLSTDDQDGILINSGFKRYQGRVTLDQSITDKLKFGVNANYGTSKNYGTVVRDNTGIPTISYMYSAWSYRPVQSINSPVNIEDELFDPELNPGTDRRTNPLVQAENEFRQSSSNNMLANAYIEYSVAKNLTLRVTGGVSNVMGTNLTFYNSKTRLGSPQYPENLGVNGSRLVNESTNFSNENTLTYSKKLNTDHSFTVVGGFSQQRNNSKANGLQAIQLPNESLGLSGLDEGTARSVVATSSSWALQSFLGRVNYNFKSKYLLTASIRTDGSSKFVESNRWGYFPSAALAYRLSAEPFMQKLKLLSDAKLRVSYGTTGNNRVSDFAALSGVTFGNSIMYSFGNNAPERGGAATRLGNPVLKWESTRQLNIGIDLALWQDRVSFTGDYYNKTTNDLLLNAQLPSATGYTTAFKNIGKVSNTGLELGLNTVNVKGRNFNWSTNFNISFNRNKVLALTENQESLTSTSGGVFAAAPKWIARLGKPIAQFYGVIFDGLYQFEDFDQLPNGTYVLKSHIPTNGTTRANIRPGDVKLKDLNNDGTVNINDYTIIGDPNPDFIGGINNNLSYGNFDLNVLFQFSYGNQVLNANRITFEGGMALPSNTNMFEEFANRWTPTNTNTDVNRRGGNGQDYVSSKYIEDGSYLRLKTVSLGYNLPSGWMRRAKVKSARIYASAQNLHVWTKYRGLDPEVAVQYTNLTPGYDYSPYPRAKTLVFGLNISF
jgi:TonB-linked SusC/RagA family outer membrane protein